MDTLELTITDDENEERVADELGRAEAIRCLLVQSGPLHWFSVTAWDASTVEEDGTHPIVWQKNGEEFLHDVFAYPPSRIAEMDSDHELKMASEEALHAFRRLAPLVDDEEERAYAKALIARLDAVLSVRAAEDEVEG